MEGASSSIIMLVVLIAVFYFMLIRPENKRKKKDQEMRDSLKNGDTITTIGEAKDSCELAGDGKDLEIGFNCRYLLDALKAVPSDNVILELSNGLSPIVLTPPDGGRSFLYMVLPVRLKAE